MFKAKIIVKMRPELKDTRGQTLEKAINSIVDIKRLTCHVGSVFYINFAAENQIEALKFVDKISSEILSNSLVETYEIRYLEEIEE